LEASPNPWGEVYSRFPGIMVPECRRHRSKPSLGEENHNPEEANDEYSCIEEDSDDHEEESDVSFFDGEGSEKDEEESDGCSYVEQDSDMLPSACLDVWVRQLRKSRPPTANCGVMECANRGSQRLFPFLRVKVRDFRVESFVFSSSPAGGEQHLRVETGVGHVVVALVSDPGEREELASCVSEEEQSASRAFAGTGL
jgi:hypothetical protein